MHDSWYGLWIFVGVCVAAALSGVLFPPGRWYEGLRKPSWRPPNWLFGPAWTILYGTIAVAGWLVWREAGWAGASVPLTIYGIQLVLNAAWSGIFFGLKRMDLAFAELCLLWIAILATIVSFHTVEPSAAWLLVPYLCWVTFAGILNFTMWRLNRGPQAEPNRGAA